MIGFIKYKVRSGALQLVVFMGILIAILLAGLVLLSYSYHFFSLQSKLAIDNFRIADTGMNYLLENEITHNDTITIQQLSNDIRKIEMQRSDWGIYEKGIIKCQTKKKTFYKCALIGSRIDRDKRPALYLQENDQPLAVVGTSVIKGNAFLPDKGVVAGNIGFDGYYGQKLIQGKIFKSNDHLPQTSKFVKKDLTDLIHNVQKNAMPYKHIDVSNSFLNPTQYYHSSDNLVLDQVKLTGNLVVKSDISITVTKNSNLKDVILIAPIIKIEDEVRGNFQAISNGNIKIGKKCKLSYPTAIVLVEEKPENASLYGDNKILIDNETVLRGTVCYFKSVVEDNFKIQTAIEKTAVIIGEVYCEGNLELKGTVKGTVNTNQFVVASSGSLFVNHIYDATIDCSSLPESFSGILLNGQNKGIAKWMY